MTKAGDNAKVALAAVVLVPLAGVVVLLVGALLVLVGVAIWQAAWPIFVVLAIIGVLGLSYSHTTRKYL